MQLSNTSKSRIKFNSIAIFIALAIIGFAYVKWVPYYHKAFAAYNQHSIGDSIIGEAGFAPPSSLIAAVDYAYAYGKSIWKAMILGLLLGSGIKVLLPSRWVARAIGKVGLKSVLLGSLFALPCMMCTCCAAPVAASMRQSRASAGSVVSWWLANPVLNPATLVFMGFVLGWKWAIFRLIFGIAMVVGVAYFVERYAEKNTIESNNTDEEMQLLLNQNTMLESAVSPYDIFVQWLHEFMTLTIRLLPEYLILILLLGAARVFLFPTFGTDSSIFWIFAMAVAGTLFVIPTAGEVPIVQAMFALGVGSGPSAALIMTLPAVSLPSLVMLGKVFSLKTRLLIACGVVLTGIIAGFMSKLVF